MSDEIYLSGKNKFMNELTKDLMPPLEPTQPLTTIDAPVKEKHKMTLTIEDIDLSTNSIDIIVKHEPELNRNVPMTAALSVAQQVMELLTMIREKNMNPMK